jgi:excisionase family DNA binding protein
MKPSVGEGGRKPRHVRVVDVGSSEGAVQGQSQLLDRIPASLPDLIDVETLARHLGVSVHHVRRLVQERRIPHLKVGAFVRFNPQEIGIWLEERRIPEHEKRSARAWEPIS